MPTESITAPEADLLASCERKIANGIDALHDARLALKKIWEERLYISAGHKTFEDYCRVRWGWSRQRGYQIIEFADVVSALPVECQPLVDNERKARELAKVPEEARAEVLKEAAEAGPVTAKAIKEAAEKRKDKPEDEEPPRVQCGVPTVNLDDKESRAHRITRAVMKACEELEAVLAGMNATPRELVQAAESLRGRAKRLEFNAAKLAEDAS